MTLQPLVHLHQKDDRRHCVASRWYIYHTAGLVACGPTAGRGMSDTQTTLTQPKQNNYEKILENQKEIKDEIFWMRKELEETKLTEIKTGARIYDLTILVGLLQAEIRVWVGVAEE